MLKSQRKGLVLLLVLWADLGLCSTDRPMVRYEWLDTHKEKQGIFTGSLNNHSILAFKIQEHYPLSCTDQNTSRVCHRKPYQLRTEVPLHEGKLPPFQRLCDKSPKMTFNQLPFETRSELLNSTGYMIVWSLKVPKRSCLLLHMHVNRSDTSSNEEGNRLYLEDPSGRYDVVPGEFQHHIQNYKRQPVMAKVVYVQRAQNETIDFHFTAQRSFVFYCRCAQYRKRSLPNVA